MRGENTESECEFVDENTCLKPWRNGLLLKTQAEGLADIVENFLIASDPWPSKNGVVTYGMGGLRSGAVGGFPFGTWVHSWPGIIIDEQIRKGKNYESRYSSWWIGNSIFGGNGLKTKANDRDRRKTNPLAYHESVCGL